MNTDNDGSSKQLMPLDDLTKKKLKDILSKIRLYHWICSVENFNSTSLNFQKLKELNDELSLFEYSLATFLIDGLINYDEAKKRGFKTDYLLSVIKKYIISQEEKSDPNLDDINEPKIKELAI